MDQKLYDDMRAACGDFAETGTYSYLQEEGRNP